MAGPTAQNESDVSRSASGGGQRHKNEFLREWGINPKIIQLNPGSFGQSPRQVLNAQTRKSRDIQRDTMNCYVKQYPQDLDTARGAAAQFVGANPNDLVFVNNDTTAINAVIKSLPFRSGDEIRVTDTEYNATRNVVDEAAKKRVRRSRWLTSCILLHLKIKSLPRSSKKQNAA